jgi:hypothetical protein
MISNGYSETLVMFQEEIFIAVSQTAAIGRKEGESM